MVIKRTVQLENVYVYEGYFIVPRFCFLDNKTSTDQYFSNGNFEIRLWYYLFVDS
ncbi:hypothetical protein Krac_10885 [Ktedonobacter racemifer DSM 44963]|uniref:Uncharacterized protein n=1 Tax=Ktedonobacter racemifer DSM 44963 TaxID=485913 RepID=D6TIS9_KTERA|nr:hypothetical protein Krac_10885 [Ktedonobacter racemifer DSM 44963]